MRELSILFDTAGSQQSSTDSDSRENLAEDAGSGLSAGQEGPGVQSPDVEEFEVLIKTLEQKDETIRELRSELSEVRSLFDETKQRLKDEALKKSEFKQRCKQLEKELDEILLRANKDSSEVHQKVQLLQERNKCIFGVMCRVQGELSDEKERNEHFLARIDDISGVYESLQEKTVDLMKFNEAIQKMMVEARSKQLELETELDTMLQRNKDILWVMCQKENKWAHAQQDNALLRENVDRLIKERDVAQNELNLTKKILTVEQKKVANLESELCRIKSIFAIKIQARYRGLRVRKTYNKVKQQNNGGTIQSDSSKNHTKHKHDNQLASGRGRNWSRIWKRKRSK